MRKFVCILAILLLMPCFSDGSSPEPLTWPPPPERSRIQFVRVVSKPADIGIKKSLIRRIWEFIAGEEPEAMSRPFGIAVSGDKIVVTDVALAGFHVFDLMKDNYKIVTSKPSKLPSPLGAAFTKDERALVVDSVLRKIFAYNSKGDFIAEFAAGFPFLRPTMVSVSPADNAVWVSDTLAHQVFKFSPTGEKLLTLGRRGNQKGEFNYPTGITIGKDGTLYVCDTMNARIQIFSSDGRFISSFGRQGDSTGDFAHPKSVALDSEGNIYVVDGLFDAVQIFDPKGRLLLVFGRKGTRNGEFYVPATIFIDEKDRIFVSDSYNGRLQIFQYLRES
jgi:DNA-binding beta-propeller fold protein YncE